MTTCDLAATTIRDMISSKRLLSRGRLVAVALVALGMGSCVISDKPLVVGSKPLLGDRFDAVLFRDFTEGSGYSAQKVGYHWSDGYYIRASAGGKHVVRFAAETLSATDFLIERSQDDRAAGQAKLFTYFIARKVADGAYLVAPLSENDLPAADREAMCDKDQPEGFCSIKDHEQLMTSARATEGKTLKNVSVAVLTFGEELKAANAPVVGAQK